MRQLFTGAAIAWLGFAAAASAAEQSAPAQPTAQAQICRLDWNHNGRGDLAIFAPAGERGHELIVMYEIEEGYGWVRLSESAHWVEPVLSCKTGETVTGTAPGPNELEGERARRTFATGGSYIEVAQPEGGVVAYFWDGAVREVWTSD